MPQLPLIAHRHPDDAIAYRAGVTIPVHRFLADVERMISALLPGRHVFNMCSDRYHFSVVLAASIVSGRTSLLPSTHTPDTVRQMQAFAPDTFGVTDQDRSAVDLPTVRFPSGATAASARKPMPIPLIDSGRIVAHVFTSGSTGLPVPHPKRWGSLVQSVRAEAERLGITPAHVILGTVPPQHMYGLESTVLLPLLTGAALHAGRPFYPADICATLAALPRPRMLVTTPHHLKALLADQAPLPPADQLLSATAPLSQNIAQAAESRFAAPLFEIYGCTETGQLASRRTRESAEWQALGDVRLRREGDDIWVEGGHVDRPAALSDVIELTGSHSTSATFLLHGRHADMVNIAGKRTSLAYLNYHLNAIEGVRDGVFLLPTGDDGDGVIRLAALVVAPDLTPAALLKALRERIDPIFLPRPLLFVDELPRNETGKLPNIALQDLLTAWRAGRPTGSRNE